MLEGGETARLPLPRGFREIVHGWFQQKIKTPEQVQRERLKKLVTFLDFAHGHRSKREDRLRAQLDTEGWRDALRTAPAEQKIALINRVYQGLLDKPEANLSKDFPAITQKYIDYFADDPINGRDEHILDTWNPTVPLVVYMRHYARSLKTELEEGKESLQNEQTEDEADLLPSDEPPE